MLVANKNEESLRQIIERKGQKGWIRSKECAKEFGKDRMGHHNPSEETKFYRWLKKVEKGKVEGFQVKKLPGNISYVGLKSARFEDIERFIEEDKKTKRSVTANLGFFEWLKHRAERKHEEARALRLRSERSIKESRCAGQIKKEILMLRPDEYSQEKIWEITKKWRQRYHLDINEMLENQLDKSAKD